MSPSSLFSNLLKMCIAVQLVFQCMLKVWDGYIDFVILIQKLLLSLDNINLVHTRVDNITIGIKLDQWNS